MALPSRESVIADVTALVANNFNKDWTAAFNHYAKDGKIGKRQLMKVLEDANAVGSILRGTVADSIIAELDADADSYITLAEFESIHQA